MAKELRSQPVTIKQANEFIREFHRHHGPTVRNNGKWALAAINRFDKLVGVVVTSHPVSATFNDGLTIEVARLCVKPDAPKGTCSFLLAKCCLIWKIMGGSKIITYTLKTESGASLRGAGWKFSGDVKPHRRWQNKSKSDGIEREQLMVYSMHKLRWEKLLSRDSK